MSRYLPVALIALVLMPGCFRREVRVIVLPPTVEAPEWGTPRGYGITYTRPRYDDGVRDGVIVGGVVRDSLADKMGLRRGDIIVSMEGVPCDGLERCRLGARRLEAALHRRRPFDIIVERAGAYVELRYRYQTFQPLSL